MTPPTPATNTFKAGDRVRIALYGDGTVDATDGIDVRVALDIGSVLVFDQEALIRLDPTDLLCDGCRAKEQEAPAPSAAEKPGDGGPASEMTLRDRFAEVALAAIVAAVMTPQGAVCVSESAAEHKMTPTDFAGMTAYDFADSAIRARSASSLLAALAGAEGEDHAK